MQGGERGGTHDDLHGEEEAGRGLACVPAENALVHYVHAGVLVGELLALQAREVATNLNDAVSSAVVHFGVALLDVVQDIAREGAIARTNLVDNEVLVGEVLEQVFRHETLSDSLPVPWLVQR